MTCRIARKGVGKGPVLEHGSSTGVPSHRGVILMRCVCDPEEKAFQFVSCGQHRAADAVESSVKNDEQGQRARGGARAL